MNINLKIVNLWLKLPTNKSIKKNKELAKMQVECKKLDKNYWNKL